MTATDATDYLTSCLPPTPGHPWSVVLDALRHDTTSPLAAACATPLGLWLLRTVYITGRRDPTRLVTDHKSYPDAAAIEDHLWDELITAVVEARAPSDPTEPLRPRHSWDPGDVRRWLSFLARDLACQKATNFDWWRLSGAAPRPLAGIIVGFIAGLAGALRFRFSLDFGIGLITALSLGLLVRRYSKSERIGLSKGVAGGILGGLIGGLGALAAFGAGPGNIFVGSFLAGGLGFGLAVAPFSRFGAALAGASVGEFVAAFSYHASIAHGIGANVGPMVNLVNGLGTALGAGLAVGLSDRGDPARGLRWSPAGFIWVWLAAFWLDLWYGFRRDPQLVLLSDLLP